MPATKPSTRLQPKPKATPENCSNCHFGKLVPGQTLTTPDSRTVAAGYCAAHPPKVEAGRTHFPVVAIDETWCGEYEGGRR